MSRRGNFSRLSDSPLCATCLTSSGSTPKVCCRERGEADLDSALGLAEKGDVEDVFESERGELDAADSI
jgi:hypothetical protein